MKILAVTNCIAGGSKIPYAPGVDLYRKTLHDHLLIDGMLAIFSGRGFKLAPELRAKVQKDAETGYFKTFGGDEFDTFHPVNPAELDALIWTPYCDATGYYLLNAKCEDGTVYPWFTGVMVQSFIQQYHPAPELAFAGWKEMIELTRMVPKRACLIYPTKYMDASTPDHARFKARVEHFNNVASFMFSRAGWKMMTVENPEKVDNVWWAHYTSESRAHFLAELDRYILGE